jgi:hypothetical protein
LKEIDPGDLDMTFRQYTKCYVHTPGDKPFNENDLLSFAAGASLPGIIAAAAAFLSGSYAIGFVGIAIQYAVTITAIAKQWLYHRLVCISGDQCAVGTLCMAPAEAPLTTSFDNDQFFNMRLMPHRYLDNYRMPNGSIPVELPSPPLGYFLPPTNPNDSVGTPPWTTNSPVPEAGPSLDGKTELAPGNDVFLDNFQGSLLVQPGSPQQAPRPGAVLQDLPYQPVAWQDEYDPLLHPENSGELPRTTTVTRSTLHCEAEGNFWQAMLDTAGLQGLVAGVGAAAGAAAGAALGCAMGGLFGPIGCAIGAVIGFIAGLLGGGAAGALAGMNAAFNSDPGDVNESNVGDVPLGSLADGDQVAVFGTHVYDGFHQGWHELHPLKAIVKFPEIQLTTPYLEWNPDWDNAVDGPPPDGLTQSDMRQGLDSPSFTAAAKAVKQNWCIFLSEAFNATTLNIQSQPQNRWTIHPLVDGCVPNPVPPPIQ